MYFDGDDDHVDLGEPAELGGAAVFLASNAGSYVKWLMTKVKVYGFRFKGLWLDIGQVDTYRRAQRYFFHKKRK